jgi:hypothetical protein
MRFLLHPKAMVPVARPPPSTAPRRAHMWSNSPPSSSNSSSKERLTSSRKSLRSPKVRNWLLPLHQIKRPMFHLKKKPRARKEEREIRDLTTLLHSIMITCLPLAPSLRYPLVKPPVSMGRTIPNRDT